MAVDMAEDENTARPGCPAAYHGNGIEAIDIGGRRILVEERRRTEGVVNSIHPSLGLTPSGPPPPDGHGRRCDCVGITSKASLFIILQCT